MHVVRLSNISRILRNLPLSKFFFLFLCFSVLHDSAHGSVRNVVGKIDKELRETPLRGCIVTENRGKGGVSERLR